MSSTQDEAHEYEIPRDVTVPPRWVRLLEDNDRRRLRRIYSAQIDPRSIYNSSGVYIRQLLARTSPWKLSNILVSAHASMLGNSYPESLVRFSGPKRPGAYL
jgi:hypothetical protein